MDRLAVSDVRTLVDIADSLLRVSSLDEFRQHALRELRRLIACDFATFNEVAAGDPTVLARVDPLDVPIDGVLPAFAAYAHQNPIIPRHAARDPAVLMLSDFLAARKLHRLELYDLVYRPLETEHQIALPILASEGRAIAVAFNRRRRDFAQRDRQLLTLAQPLIARAYELARLRSAFALQPLPNLDLTTRQTEILRLVAQGRTNPEIAGLLSISPRTVAKHLENIYRRLGVSSRLAVIRRLLDAR